MLNGDANEALEYLKKLSSLDPLPYWRHFVDGEKLLCHLFWVDGKSTN